MDKTTIYLPLELKTALRRLAVRRGVSEAEVIRQAIQRAVSEQERPRPHGGVYASDVITARDADEHLRGFGER